MLASIGTKRVSKSALPSYRLEVALDRSHAISRLRVIFAPTGAIRMISVLPIGTTVGMLFSA